jgi:hypothetical protein
VFSVFAGAEAVWEEISRLTEEIPQAFSQYGLTLTGGKESRLKEGWSSSRTAYSYEVTSRISRQRTPRQLIFLFDLWRPPAHTQWEHAEEALLTVAYTPSARAPWGIGDIVVGGDGRLAEEYSRQKLLPYADSRLLDWVDDSGTWYERSWLFSVPLMKIDSPAAFQKEITEPVIAILLKGAEPAEALEKTHAIRFRT